MLNLIFIPKYGFIAAAWTTFVCYSFLVIAHGGACSIILKNKGIRIKNVYDIRFILLFSIALVLYMILFLTIYQRLLARILCLFLLQSLYV